MIPILILAAGASTRMRGVDKLMEPIDGQPLLRTQIDRAATLGGAVFVALPDSAHPRNAVLTDTVAKPLYVADAAEGMGATLRGAVSQLPPCDAFMVLLADLAALDANDLQQVSRHYSERPDHLIWRGTTQSGKPGHPIIFDASLRPAFGKLSGDSGAHSIAHGLRDKTCFVPLPDNHARLDLDTPEDWTAFRAKP
jgi:CTP:molybdopterin cytidylyltransferase MocA